MACVSGAATRHQSKVLHRPLAFFDTRCSSGLTDSVVWRPDFDEAVSRCFRRTPIFPTEAALQGIHQIDHIAWLRHARSVRAFHLLCAKESENRSMILVYVTGSKTAFFVVHFITTNIPCKQMT